MSSPLLLAFPQLREVTALMISFGAAFPTFYRLVGPYRSSQAEKIVKTELWDTIKRRGVIGNIFMGVIPMVRYFSSSLIFGILADI
jgi:dimethylaniline monooxygenase (N-oxide forming)